MASDTSSCSSSLGGQEQQQVGKELLKAAKFGDSTSMRAMASQDRKILHGKTPAGNTCLHISCIYGHEGFCKDVLELEESLINTVNLDGKTPLITSVRNGHISLASFLLTQHCSVLGLRQAILQQDKYGFNALHHAICSGHKDLSLELVTAEPALSQAVGKHNESPMYFAVMRNLTQVFEKLIQNPLSACSGGQHGRNCLQLQLQMGIKVRHIISGLQITVSYNIISELQAANLSFVFFSEFVKIIMKKRPELAREADILQYTPIADAVRYGKVDILQVMLEHDSTLGYLIGSSGFPLLNTAAFRVLVAVVRKLLEHCPDAPYLEPNGSTLLHRAVLEDQLEFVEFVLRTPILRKLVNMQDNNGRTALHYAIGKCNPRVVAALLSHVDIDATLLDKHGDSAASRPVHD